MMTEFGKAIINVNGYYAISTNGKNHNKLLHRLVYEKFHKLTLLSSAIIHHKDGDKLNNDINNLEMMSKSEHNKIHHKNKINSPETLDKMSECKLGKNNPMYGTGSCNYYRVYKSKCSHCKQGYTWVYEYPNNGKQRQISRVNFNDLEKVVKSKGLEWHKIDEVK